MDEIDSARSTFSAPGQIVARAPGRLDVMGGIADYSGSLVLQFPLAVGTEATVGFSSRSTYEIASAVKGSDGKRRGFAIPIDKAAEILRDYESARAYFAASPDDHWASYVLGSLTVLHIEEGFAFPAGLSVRIVSDVPEGKGVSSSAALEVSVMGALLRLLDIELEHERIAHLCQIVENRIAGAPCGIMDQMTAACGKSGHLLSLLCQPAELLGQIRLPDGVSLWGIDSGIRHSVGGSDYGTVRTAAAMGYRIIARLEGLQATSLGEGRVSMADDRFGGYLANLGSARLDRHLRSLPETMRGDEFLRDFDGISDERVAVEPSRSYPVRAATVHPVREHERNLRFASLLKSDAGEKTLAIMGELMYLSHASYTACGLGSDGTDRICELVNEEGHRSGLFGARITGGGSGGTVAVLATSDAGEAVRGIAKRYEAESGLESTVFEGSSDGLTARPQALDSKNQT